MFKRIIVFLLIAVISISSFAFAAEDLDSPLKPTSEIKTYEDGSREGDSYFKINWNNPASIIKLGNNVEFEVDFKVGNNPWQSETNAKLSGNSLTWDGANVSHIVFDPIVEKVSSEKIDVKNNYYSFRIRYKFNGNYGNFSTVTTAGNMDYYENASEWAEEELDRAKDLDLITNAIRDDMTKNVTREEFAEVLMKMYVRVTGKTVAYSENYFSDTENPEVLKAAELGIVTGNGYDQFKPDEYVTRQELCTMIYRAIKLLHPELDFNVQNVERFVDQASIDQWALEGMQFMYKNKILKGDGYGKIDPLGNSSREVATILILRAYEKFE